MISESMRLEQAKAVAKLEKLRCGALISRCGTGKTKMALDLAHSKISKGKANKLLWICPFSTKQNFLEELKKWYPDMPCLIVGAESISQSVRIFSNVKKYAEDGTFCVVDESLKIKNSDTHAFRRISAIGKLCRYRLILNGTLITNNITDVWAQMEFLSPLILNMSEESFRRKYCVYDLNQPKSVKASANLEHLFSLLAPYIYEFGLDLDVTQGYITHEYENDNITEYLQAKQELITAISEMNDASFFKYMTKLQQSYTKSVSRRKVLDEILTDGEKYLIYVKFLANIPEDALRVTGEEKQEERDAAFRKFEESEQVLYITYGCGAFGLNLQFCHNIIFLDQTWDYAQKVQAEHRIFRIGQQENCTYHNTVCTCGMEQMIMRCVSKKTNLLGAVKKEIKEQGLKEWAKNI